MNELGLLAGATALLAIVAQTGAMFYWGGKISAIVSQHEKRIENLEERLDFWRDSR